MSKQEQPQVITARDLLRRLDRDDLAKQIEEAKAKMKEAKEELSALVTLEKIRAIKAGEFVRKSPQRKKKAEESKAAAVAESPKNGKADNPKTQRGRIEEHLAQSGPASSALISLSVGIPQSNVSSLLSQNGHLFVNTGSGWDLKVKH